MTERYEPTRDDVIYMLLTRMYAMEQDLQFYRTSWEAALQENRELRKREGGGAGDHHQPV